jgi:hypothetical protein
MAARGQPAKERSARDRLLLSVDGQQEAPQSDIRLPGIASGDSFTIEFLDEFGTEFRIFDEYGGLLQHVIASDLTQINLPHGVFPGQAFYPGVQAAPGCSITLFEFVLEYPADAD